MPRLRWSESLATGIKRIDDQHRGLIDLCNTVIDNVEKGHDAKVVRTALTALREYTVYHFHAEEDFLREQRYPGLREHEGEHHTLLHRVKSYQRMLWEHQEITAGEVKLFLKEWLIDHILDKDMQYVLYVRKRQAEVAARAEQAREAEPAEGGEQRENNGGEAESDSEAK